MLPEYQPEDATTSEARQASEVSFEDEDAEEGEALLTFRVTEGGARLDKWLADRLPEYSRAQIQRWIAEGRVTAGVRSLKPSHKVVVGEEIAVVVPEPEDYAVEPEPIPLTVLYEDDDLLVIDKPAGMVVHPAAGNYHGTLVNAVLYRCPNLAGIGGVRRPGIVHRLDKDTSGVILIAKNAAAQLALQAQFKNREVHKTYVALVHGWIAERRGEIAAALGRDPRHRQRMAVVPSARGRSAITHYEVRGYFAPATASLRPAPAAFRYTLVACYPLTGRTHQIRVHLAYIRHPIVGDPVYRGGRPETLSCPRQFLHAERIRFRLPATGQEVEFSAPLPADLQAVLAGLQEVATFSPSPGR